MIILSKGAVTEVESALVTALLSAGDYRGRPFVLPTIDPELLHRAALAALGVASGQTIWELGTPPLEVEPDERLPFLKKIYPER